MKLGEIHIDGTAWDDKDFEYCVECEGDNDVLMVMLHYMLREAAEQMGVTYEAVIERLNLHHKIDMEAGIEPIKREVTVEEEIVIDVNGLIEQLREDGESDE